ncbi:unnamed protein product [Ophioblennius macclurei]
MNQTTVDSYGDSLHGAIIKNMITVLLCVSIIYVNGTLVHIFARHQIFNTNPRYILYIHLVINDTILIALYLLLQFLTYSVGTFNVALCMVLVMAAVLSNQNNPLTIALMSGECYVAVCFPLRHSSICSVRRVYVVIALVWLLNSLSILPDLFVTVATEPAHFFYSRTFCLRKKVFNNEELETKRSISNTIFLVFVWLTVILSYFRILLAAQAATANARKARNTVLLHGFQLLLCMFNFLFNLLLKALLAAFPRRTAYVLYLLAVLNQVLPRFINPIAYGIRDKTFRKYLKMYLLNVDERAAPKTRKRSR